MVDVEIPTITRPDDYDQIRELRAIADIKGWDYVSTKIAEQLERNPSYSDQLVKVMPTSLNRFLSEYADFPQEQLGFMLAKLLFPYKPEGYEAAMKVVWEVVYYAKGYIGRYDELKEELDWIEREASLKHD
jgi:hypothetical protein